MLCFLQGIKLSAVIKTDIGHAPINAQRKTIQYTTADATTTSTKWGKLKENYYNK